MSPATITASKSAKAATGTPTTKCTMAFAGDDLLFSSVMQVQDLKSVAATILGVMKGGDERAKSKAKTDMNGLTAALGVVSDNLWKAVKLYGKKFLCERLLSSKRCETIASIKKTQATVEPSKRKSPEKTRVDAMLSDVSNVPSSSKKIAKTSSKKTSPAASAAELKIQQFVEGVLPENGTHYDLHELVTAIRMDSESPIFDVGVKKVHDYLQPLGLVVCGRSTLARWCTDYKNNNQLAPKGWDGANVGQPPLVSKKNIPSLNETVLAQPGVVSGPNDIAKQLHEAECKDREERGMPQLLVPRRYSRHTLRKYFHLAATEPGVNVVLASSARTQGARREMAHFSERNLASNIATVLEFGFVPGEWTDKPDNLPPGAKLAHQMIECAKGQPMRPVDPAWIFNYDFSSYYTWLQTSPRNGEDMWKRVKSESNTDYVQVSDETMSRGNRKVESYKKRGEEIACNGLQVKWLDCTSAGGMIFPVVMMFEGFDHDIMPMDDFLYLEVPGLSVNGHLDAKSSKNPGYVVLKRKGAKMENFFAWFTETVVVQYFRAIRDSWGMSSHDDIPDHLKARIWSDSDMTNIATITTLAEMEANFKKGLLFAKFGAKTTGWTQPQDNGPFFKTKRSSSRINMSDKENLPKSPTDLD